MCIYIYVCVCLNAYLNKNIMALGNPYCLKRWREKSSSEAFAAEEIALTKIISPASSKRPSGEQTGP